MPSVLGESALGPLRGIPRDGDGDGQIHDGTHKEQAVPRSPVLPQHQPVNLRSFGDSAAIRGKIFDRVREAASTIPPITNQRHTMTLEDVGYEGATKYSVNDWKKAILGGRSLGTRLRGTWVLRDNDTGAVVDRKRSTVATVPYLTDHGTFIQNGSEYTLAHQLRLRPGVFTRVQANGELEAHVNVMPGKGMAHRIFMEPDTGVFRLKVGQSKMPLTGLLRAMGASDSQLRNAWGDLYQVNALKDDPSVIGKLHEKLVRKPDPNKTQDQEVREAFESMGLDPEVTKRTLGKPYDRVSLDQMLDTTKKLVAISHGQAEPDDRDHLAYMTAMGPEDLLSERVGKDRMLLGKTLWKASMTGSLKHVQPELLTKGINAAIMTSGLGQPTECFSADTFVLTERGFIIWPEVTEKDRFACRINGKIEYHRATKLSRFPFKGMLYGCRTQSLSYLVTPDHRLYNRPRRNGYRFDEAKTAHGKCRWFAVGLGVLASPACVETFTLEAVAKDRYPGDAPLPAITIDLGDWLEFLGWWVAEGSAMPGYKGREWRVTIAQSRKKNPDNCAMIESLLDRIGFHWRYSAVGREYIIRNKVLAFELFKYGNAANTKRIPRYVFRLPETKLERLFTGYFGGDGHQQPDGHRKGSTVSYGLALDLVELQGRLGGVGHFAVRDMSGRNADGANYHDQYPIGFCNQTEAYVIASSNAASQGKPEPYFLEEYDGTVYCATVPGGLLFVLRDGRPHWSGNSINPAMIFDQQTRVSRLGVGGIPSLEGIPPEARNVQPSHFGLIDPLFTPESLHVGVDGRVTQATLKGDDGRLYSPFRNVKTGQMEHHSAQDLADSVVAFPGELKTLKPYVSALIGSKIRDVPRNQVQYELPNMDDAFSAISNLVPLKSTIKGQREVMATRMLTQALPLKDPQAPLVQTGIMGSNNDSYESRYGKQMGALHSDVGGVVQHVDKDKGKITVRGDDGRVREHDLYVNYPYNRKTYIHQTPVVGPGDRVAPGGLLARSNYTDNQGVTAIGQNARVAYVPFRGLNFEDAIVVSDSMAKRFSSEHMYQHSLDTEDGVKTGKKVHISTFPGVFDRKALDTVDDDGAVKPGTVVTYGSPLILAVKQRERTHGAISRGRSSSWADHTETWKHHAPGEVTDVEKTANGIVVSVKSLNPMEVGDKMSGRHGDKGVVSAIVPDHEMPMDNAGRPFEVLLNPLGVITRTNPAQKIEAALGKVAEKTGQPYRVVDFDNNRDYNEWAIQELARHGMSSAETIHDPVAGRDIPRILTGNRWFMKLHHTSESKGQGRGTGGYTAEGAPARGGEGGSKRISLMDINAVLSHGACFMGSANVLTEQGWLEISAIVKKRMTIKVACADMTTGRIVYRPVIDWLCRCVPDEELMLLETYARAGNRAERGAHQAIRVTRGHQFYVPGGKKQAFYLQPGDVIYTVGTKFDKWQEQLVIGTLLGDGYAGNRDDTMKSAGLANVHGFDQRDYLDWKHSKLANVVMTPPKPSKISKGSFAKKPTSRFTTRQHPQISAIAAEFYTNGIKSPPPGIVARAGWLGIGVWFGDDGGCVYSNKTGRISAFRFHTNAFTIDEVDRLASELSEFTGLQWRRHMQNGKYPILTLGNSKNYGDATGQLQRWIDMISPYVPPAHAHKLRIAECGQVWADLQPREGEFIEETTVKSIRPYTPAAYENNLVYNITVEEHHNYIVHGILVGNTEVLRDAGAVRGQQHPEFWQQFMSGHAMPTPKTPMIYDKFINLLKAGGINVVRQGSRLNVMALSNNDINDLAGDREVTSGDTVDWKGGLKPIPGGLFDEKLTGGHGGNRWSYIKLAEPLPNPVMEEPIRRMLGLTKDKFMDVLAGKEQIGDSTGSAAIAKALDNIDVDQSLAQARADIRSGRKGARDAAVRKLGYLKMVKKTGVHPRDWMIDKAPVLPPMFRPVSTMAGSKLPMVADANYLYKELIDARDNLRDMTGTVNDLSNERLAAYQTLKGVTGLGDPIHPKNQERGVRGMLKQVFGNSPKTGMVQRKLLASATDLVGRATIVPNPDLDMDQVGLPETRAWDVYQPFIVRRLVRRGMNRMDAVRAVKERKPEAREAMVHEMDARPVILNRAPVHHRYGIMAFRPRLEKGDTLHVSPLIVTGFGADFDGDAMQYHVPATDEAVRDAYEKMLPSRNLLATSSFKAHQLPSREYAAGLYAASAMRTDRRPRVFATKADALAAYRRGEINVDHPVEIVDDR